MATKTQNTALALSPNELQAAARWKINPKNYVKMAPMLNIADQYTAAWDEANAANETRYQQGLGGWDRIADLYKNWNPTIIADDPYQYGKSQRKQIETGRNRTIAAGMGNLASAGMANSTLAGSVFQGANRTASEQNMSLDDAINQYRVGRQDARITQQNELGKLKTDSLANAYQGKLGWIGAKEDSGPDANFFSQMLGLFAKHPGRFKGISEAQLSQMMSQAYRTGA